MSDLFSVLPFIEIETGIADLFHQDSEHFNVQ